MTLYRPNPSQVTLYTTAHNIDGTPKTSLASAKVRVYHMDGATETEDLALTNLVQVGTTNTWRYVWLSPGLGIGVYQTEYQLVDNDGAEGVDVDTFVVMDVAQETTLVAAAADITLIKKVETGRWKIDEVTDVMTFYDDDGVTPLLEFNLKDIGGIPSHINIFERDPV
jgi:hypothetical protein